MLVACMSTSCSESLDINTNPLVASTADPNVILPYVFVQYSNRHVTELGTRTMDVPQHFTACFNSPATGPTTIFLTGNTWGMYYTQVLGNLALIEADAEAAGVTNNNVNAIARIFKAKSFFELSCIWEKIPFSEALDGATYPFPQFDDQETIFKGIISILDEAIDLIRTMPAEGNFDVSVGDLIYNGNMELWQRYANSLKLRVYMLIRNKDTSVDGDIANLINEPMIESNAQAAMIRYFDTPAESNAYNRLVEAFFGVSNQAIGVYAPGDQLYDLLANGDPRFDLLISDPNGTGGPGLGNFAFAVGGATIKDNVIRNDIPHFMFLPSEINFYKAELALKGVTGGNAQEYFNLGLTQILQFWGMDIPGAQIVIGQDVIDNYVGSLSAVDLQAVYEQLYLESFLRPIVAWNTVRRTKVPVLELPPGTRITTILKRFTYPPDEATSNINTPANLSTDVPHWFEN